MKLNPVSLRKSINKAFLKVKPNRTQIENFKKNILHLYDQIDESESEEFHKNIIRTFLRETYYSPDYYINTKGNTDLVIHNGKDTTSTVGVLIETKKPSKKAEMPTQSNLNAKAMHELMLYYLRERISGNNKDIKHLIITNIHEWFVFDAGEFYRLFAQNKQLVKQYTEFAEGRTEVTKTDYFYSQIAKPFLDELKDEITFTYIDIRAYEHIIRNKNKQDDNKLVALFKLFSPEQLLKLPFANDSNTLDKRFYTELLHIIGLQETKEGSKKLIGRKKETERNAGSLIENAITILKYEDCLSQIKTGDYGANKEEQLYNVALELVITWINRILFLKLLEGQLVKYHSGEKQFQFLNSDRIADYDELNKLFFQVLAIKESERSEQNKKKFANIPYLNSSLFEPNDLEHKTIRISNLEDEHDLPVIHATVLKDKAGKRVSGKRNTLEYLFAFLDAYDFASEGSEEIQEENKTLINASVLGLIFEKINGYKDGSFFTPGFITMYMARETIRRAVVEKFDQYFSDEGITGMKEGLNRDLKDSGIATIKENRKYKSINDIYNAIGTDFTKVQANQIINSLKICDPAVGSGHFLVSALNEIIALKSELKILSDKEGRILRDYHVEVVNDELVVTDDEGQLFEYKPGSRESQRVQETLFHEKQTIIENCLFGVDINPNSVKICRLRLWIELLKNAYYRQEPAEQATPEPVTQSHLLSKSSRDPVNPSHQVTGRRLETLPNIDINIKTGNSLISRYALDADMKKALKKSRWNIDDYRLAVMTYRNAQTKEVKREMENLIDKIKNDFESEIAANDKRVLRLNKQKGELFALTNQQQLFDLSRKEKAEWNKKVKKLTQNIQKLDTELEEIRTNKIYENAFEWRFEFPEVLNDDGDFTGFDVVIGNPPYSSKISQETKQFSESYNLVEYKSDPYALFIEKAINISNANNIICLITPLTYLTNHYYYLLRKYLIDKKILNSIIVFEGLVFEEANVDTSIIQLENINEKYSFNWGKIQPACIKNISFIKRNYSEIEAENRYEIFEYLGPIWATAKKKIINESVPLKELRKISLGMKLKGNDNYVSDIQNEEFPDKIIFGKDVEFYKPLKGKRYFSWKNSKKIGGTQNHLVYKTKPKILIQAIRNLSLERRIVATMDTEGLYFIGTVNGLTPIHSELDFIVNEYYLLAILNSNLINFFFKSQFTTISLTASFLGELPIKKVSTETQNLIGKLAKEALFSATDIKRQSFINELNSKIYHIYNLTNEQIRIVEES